MVMLIMLVLGETFLAYAYIDSFKSILKVDVKLD